MTTNRHDYIRDIRETCALAGKPERAQAFMDAGTATADVRTKLLGERVDLVASMKRMHGITEQPQAKSGSASAPVVDLVAEMRRLHNLD